MYKHRRRDIPPGLYNILRLRERVAIANAAKVIKLAGELAVRHARYGTQRDGSRARTRVSRPQMPSKQLNNRNSKTSSENEPIAGTSAGTNVSTNTGNLLFALHFTITICKYFHKNLEQKY